MAGSPKNEAVVKDQGLSSSPSQKNSVSSRLLNFSNLVADKWAMKILLFFSFLLTCAQPLRGEQRHSPDASQQPEEQVKNQSLCFSDSTETTVDDIILKIQQQIEVEKNLVSDFNNERSRKRILEKLDQVLKNYPHQSSESLKRAVFHRLFSQGYKESFLSMVKESLLIDSDQLLSSQISEFQQLAEDFHKLYRLQSTQAAQYLPTSSVPFFDQRRFQSVYEQNRWRREYTQELEARGLANTEENLHKIQIRLARLGGQINRRAREIGLSEQSQDSLRDYSSSVIKGIISDITAKAERDFQQTEQNLALGMLAFDLATVAIPGGLIGKAAGKGLQSAFASERSIGSLKLLSQSIRNLKKLPTAQKTQLLRSIHSGARAGAGLGYVFGAGTSTAHRLIDSLGTKEGFFCRYSELFTEHGGTYEDGIWAALIGAPLGGLAASSKAGFLFTLAGGAGLTTQNLSSSLSRSWSLLQEAEEALNSGKHEEAQDKTVEAYQTLSKAGVDTALIALPFLSSSVRRATGQELRNALSRLKSFVQRKQTNRPSPRAELPESVASLSSFQEDRRSLQFYGRNIITKLNGFEELSAAQKRALQKDILAKIKEHGPSNFMGRIHEILPEILRKNNIELPDSYKLASEMEEAIVQAAKSHFKSLENRVPTDDPTAGKQNSGNGARAPPQAPNHYSVQIDGKAAWPVNPKYNKKNPDGEAMGELRKDWRSKRWTQDSGYVKNPHTENLKNFLNVDGSPPLKLPDGKYDFVITLEEQFLFNNHRKEFYKHPNLVGGMNPLVRSAGEFFVKNGQIFKINNASGHFLPNSDTLDYTESFLLGQNIYRNILADQYILSPMVKQPKNGPGQ